MNSLEPSLPNPSSRGRLVRSLALGTSFSLALLTACSSGGGGGGGTGSVQPTGNLRVVSVRVLPIDPSNPNQNPHAAHEMRIGTTIESTADFTNVPVSFVMLHAEDVDNEGENVRQFEASNGVWEAVGAGTNEYEAWVPLPRDLEQFGTWYLIADLDPADTIQETNEDDNQPTETSKVLVEIGNSNTHRCDIVIENATVDEGAVVLRPEHSSLPPVGTVTDKEDHDFDATLEITSTGWQVRDDVDIAGEIIIPGRGRYDLRVWDEDAERYNSRVFTTITPGTPNTVNLDVYFTPTTRRIIREELQTGASNVFDVVFEANGQSGHAEWELGSNRYSERGDDDQITVQVVIILPTDAPNACNEVLWDAGYKKDWRNKYFGVGVDFGTEATLDERGAIGEAHARVPVKLMNIASNAVDLTAFANVEPHEGAPSEAEFDFDFSIFGVSIYNANSTDPSYTFDETQSIVRTYEQRGVVFAGPIPIQLRAVATGTLGFRTRAFLDPALMELESTAFADLSALAEATVNVGIASGGVAGTVTLLHDEFTAEASCTLGTPAAGRVTGTLEFKVTNDLIGPTGRLYLFETHKEPKWCHKVIPCGVRTVRNEKTLVRFKTFRKTDVLFHDTMTSSVCL